MQEEKMVALGDDMTDDARQARSERVTNQAHLALARLAHGVDYGFVGGLADAGVEAVEAHVRVALAWLYVQRSCKDPDEVVRRCGLDPACDDERLGRFAASAALDDAARAVRAL